MYLIINLNSIVLCMTTRRSYSNNTNMSKTAITHVPKPKIAQKCLRICYTVATLSGE